MPVAALFVRDAFGLGVPPGAAASSPVGRGGTRPIRPGQCRTAPGGRRRVGGRRQAVVAHHVGIQQGPPDGADERAWLQRQVVQAAALFFDPPDFALLAGRSALRDVLRTTFADALRWADGQRRTLLMPPHGHLWQFDYDTIRSVAEQVAQRHRVSPNAVRGCAIVLPVEGNWWRRCSPGTILCSAHAAEDRARHGPHSPTPSNRDSTPEHDDGHVATSPQDASRARSVRALSRAIEPSRDPSPTSPRPPRPKRPMWGPLCPPRRRPARGG